MKLAVLTTHPIQYQVPWFRRLAATEGVELSVFFCMIPDAAQQGVGFGVSFEWDVPLLDGYTYQVLENIAQQPSVARFDGCDTPSIYARLKAGQFDAVIVNGWVVKSCLQTVWACRRLGIPCIVRGESNALRHRAWWKKAVHMLLLKQFRACLAIGSSNRDFYLERKVPPDHIFMTPYCVDNAFFAGKAEQYRKERPHLRALWRIPEESVLFLFVGKFEAKKHPMDLLRALAVVPEKAHVLMVGSGVLLEECKSFAATEKLPVTFAGFLNQGEIAKAYAAADVLVLPSDFGETWGLVVNEAMACGLPAIVSDQVGCHVDLIQPEKTGTTFPCGDAQALAERMQHFVNSPDAARTLGDHAREHIASFNFDRVSAGVVEALNAICGAQIPGQPSRSAGESV